MSDKKKQVTRRQFLNYTLTGVGGFMAAGLLMSPLRMAIDPVLQPSGDGDYANVGLAVDDITKDPQPVEWEIEQVDAWYKSDVTQKAFVFKDDKDEIVALSPKCTHLGCMVSWEGSESHPDQFYCPCHDGRFTKDGTNIEGTPPTEPLHEYEHKVEDGMLFLGKAYPRGEA
ncbi:ubiquinol-cytochrome c reductase iron-sulfur subunit [Cerasibacillus terrae]|uniref:Menaquinol:cytochrome c reductase iron-sulfur subunit n=1 Tax=Cerasibacillus terrae TaxID=2498845 RepID=A0A5C8P2N7_9BACI|nr:ubiquinol-cytochrome c reductase iron-sulfur subunit [Cerasibacillus terrae]TXL67851.1 ubiquinol-cytochrome c reductase iron-sulfur subunit [Cerasibacillus terrae]